jgi:hypothetical protein
MFSPEAMFRWCHRTTTGWTGPLSKGTTASGNSSGGGLLSGNGADVNAASSAQVNTFIGGGALITAGQDVLVAAVSHNQAAASGTGNAIGVVGIGAILASADALSATRSHIDGAAVVVAGHDVTLLARTLDVATATAQASGGGLASGTGADARANVSPTTQAFIGDLAAVSTGHDLLVAGQAETHSTATSTGTSVGGVSVGASFAEAKTIPVVSALVGELAVLQAGHGITVSALYNIDDEGNGINTTKANATGSAGSLLAGILAGAEASTIANVHVSAGIGANAHLDVTENLEDSFVTVASRAHNSVQANATGNSKGLFTGDGGASGTKVRAIVHTEASAVVGNGATIGESPVLQGNLKNVTIASTATSVIGGTAAGASGKNIAGSIRDLFSGEISVPAILSGGGSVVDFDIENVANTIVGDGARIKAEGQVSITADSTVDADGTASMTSGSVASADAAVLVDVFLDADAIVTIHDGARIEGGAVLLGAHNQIDGSAVATANANASLGKADAAATSRFNVGSVADPAEALVNLGSNTSIIGRNAVNIEALNDQAGDTNLLSKAKASSFGGAVVGDAIAEANGTVQVRATVVSGNGSVLSSGGLSVNADSTVGIDRTADSDAASAVTEFVRQAKTVVRKITRWLPWPLNKIVEFVTETIFVLVPKVTNCRQRVRQVHGFRRQAKDTVNLNGDIFSFGTQNGSLTVQADPNDPDNIVVDPSSNMSVTLVDVDGDGITDISVGDIVSGSSANINITAAKGDIIGDARVHINKVIEEVHIVNNTNKNLVINRLDMVGSNEEDPDLNFQSENGQEYEVDSAISSSTLKIDNNGTGDIIFAKAFSNVTALLDVFNQGGDIHVLNSDVYLETGDVGHLSLKTGGGSIGSAELPFRVRLVRGKVLPDGSESTLPAELIAEARHNIFLDVTGINNTFDELDPWEMVDGIVLNLTSFAGDIHAIARGGVIIDTLTEETTNENGETVVTEKEVSRAAAVVYDFKKAVSFVGNVDLEVTGDLNVGQISAQSGTALLESTGSILHANNVFAGEFAWANVSAAHVALTANSIGSPVHPLTTQAGNLEATAAGGVWITNWGPLTISGIGSGGPLTVGATSPVTVIGNITSVADLVLFAGDSAAAGDDLIITAGATVQSTAGSVTLLAGDNFRLDAGSSVIAAGTLNIMVDSGDADPGIGGTVTIEGLLLGHPVVIHGGTDNDVVVVKKVDQGMPLQLQTGAGNDLILVGSHATPASNTAGTLHTILDLLSVDGGPGFDELRLDNSGVSADVVGTLSGGQLSGLGLKTPITYQNVDSVVVDLGSGDDTFYVGNADAHVTLNMHAGHDRVEVGAMSNGLMVDFGEGNDKLKVSAETIGNIVAYGGAGNDHLSGGKGNDLLSGGAGNDKLSGGWGDDILLGDAGNDRLSGGPGRDVLVGGTGHDKLSGGGDGDLLIGGSTVYDNNVTALRAISAEWSRRDVSEHERIRHIRFGGGLNGAWVLNPTTVLDDHAHDKLDGNFCTDWLVISDVRRDHPKRQAHHPSHHHASVFVNPDPPAPAKKETQEDAGKSDKGKPEEPRKAAGKK